MSSAVGFWLVALTTSVNAQQSTYLAAGRVTRPSGSGRPEGVAGQWVVLHRVGSDRAGPVDSARSGPDGRFTIRYRPSGATDALYFLSSRYAGIAYFSPPLRAATVRGGDADVIVYDTTTDVSHLSVQGRHFVLSQTRGSGARREVAEVFELDNDGRQTIVARDSLTPIWSTHLPVEAESASVAPGDVSAGAVVFRRGRAELFAPISPGVRQLVLTYRLKPKAFPLSQPVERPVSVLEVLLEEPRASVEGARLTEVAAAFIEGRSFRRFLAQDVPGNAVIRIDAPVPAQHRQGAMRAVAGIVGALMLFGGIVWLLRRRRSTRDVRPALTHEQLIADIAALDSRFERDPAPSDDTRAAYMRERASLKERLARALAGEEARI